MLKLYKVTTRKEEWYVIANNPAEAEEVIHQCLGKADYGFDEDRRVINIQWLTDQVVPDFKDFTKPQMYVRDRKLLFASKWMKDEERTKDSD